MRLAGTTPWPAEASKVHVTLTSGAVVQVGSGGDTLISTCPEPLPDHATTRSWDVSTVGPGPVAGNVGAVRVMEAGAGVAIMNAGISPPAALAVIVSPGLSQKRLVPVAVA
jgi:hypothetical protein